MRWSDEEVEVLKKLYPGTPNRELAERLRRSQYSVEMKAKRLRLQKEPSPPPGKEPRRYVNEFAVITREEATKRDKVELLRYCWSLTDMFKRELDNPGLDDARRQKIMNSIVMSGARILCGKKITDSLTGKDVEILDSAQRLPKGHRLILGDASKVTL